MRAIHVGLKQLGWDEAAYRDVLEQLTRKRSAADCTDAELGQLLDFMREKGFGRPPGYVAPAAAPSTDNPAGPQIVKIKDLWGQLADGGHLNDPSEAALRAFGKRVTGVHAPEFMTVPQRVKVIEALKAWVKREERKMPLTETN